MTGALASPSMSGRRLRIYYGTQQSVCPPTFVLFVNDKTLMHYSYERYLHNQFRKAFGFDGTPAFLINGISLIGNHPKRDFDRIIGNLLQKPQAMAH